jgi:RNA-binding protein 5/10
MLAAQSAIPGAPVHKQPSYPPGIIGLPSNALVATALQAAQWSMNNGYGGSTAVPTTLATTVPVKPKQMWPKHFETNGAAYAFQPKTGYFLDSVTEFFYCPKSKLYYSAKDGIYYQFDPSIDPPFKRFDPPLPTEEETQPEEKESADGSSSAARAPISLSLGLKSKGSKSGGLANSAAKKVMVDIAKWGAIQREDDEDEVDTNAANKGKAASITNPGQAPNVDEKKTMVASTSATTTGSVEQADQPSLLAEKSVTESSNLSSPQTSVDAQNTSSASSNTVKATSGSCICKLCKRQFNSAEMLARHEKESKLHAENLAKQKAAAGAAPPRQYRDRAEERREKFGSVPDHIPSVTSATVASSAVNDNILPFPPNAETVSAPVLFDESNPGNQMLRKMGWKEGQGLGKDGEGKEEAVGVELATGKNTNTAMHSTLKSTVGTSGVNSSMSYKECVKAATLARFEQLQRSEEK